METAIRFDGVSKRFILHRERARSFQELALNLLRGRGNGRREEFWALQDVSFGIAPGETVGLIGPNGAGKSTVLKLISRIIKPTSGRIEVNGRVGALLELGAGFHPDLTGRENVYLNGAILGLSRAEIQRKLDDIVAFAELERFIDVPVKHYSSGMYVRLGFSIAVHTEPEILLVDEVLAVGDAAFQRKCLERIRALRNNGVTILIVTHDLDAVQRNCSRLVWMNTGEVVSEGNPESVVRQYIEWSLRREMDHPQAESLAGRRWGAGDIEITQVRILDDDGQEKSVFRTAEPMVVEIRYRATRSVEYPVFGLAIHRSDGVHVTGPNTFVDGNCVPMVSGEGLIYYKIPSMPLLEGEYFISVSVHDEQETTMYDYHDRLYPFAVLKPRMGQHYGLMVFGGRWLVGGKSLGEAV